MWTTRPHEPGEPARHVAELSEAAGSSHAGKRVALRARRKGRRHVHAEQEETFVVLAGTLSMYVGEPPERHDVPTGGIIHIEPGRRSKPRTTVTPTSSSTPTAPRPITVRRELDSAPRAGQLDLGRQLLAVVGRLELAARPRVEVDVRRDEGDERHRERVDDPGDDVEERERHARREDERDAEERARGERDAALTPTSEPVRIQRP